MVRKRLLYFFIFLVMIYGGIRLYFYATDGFSVANITTHLANNPAWEMRPLTYQEQDEANNALSQTYRYWAKGHQAYVFISEDEKYVLKFLKFQRIRVDPWLANLPYPSFMNSWVQEKVDHKNNKLMELFKSWKIAFENLKDETALLMVHLNKTDHLNQQIKIVDPIGISHSLNLDDAVFLLQKKADLMCPQIQQWMSSNKKEDAQKMISSMLALYISEYQRGLGENDQHILRNMAILDDKPVHIDLGRFVKDEHLKNPKVYRNELVYKLLKFRIWLQTNFPELADYLTKELEKAAHEE